MAHWRAGDVKGLVSIEGDPHWTDRRNGTIHEVTPNGAVQQRHEVDSFPDRDAHLHAQPFDIRVYGLRELVLSHVD
jgi:hypothetical protein